MAARVIEVFQSNDLDGSGTLDKDELNAALQCLGWKKKYVTRLIKRVDTNANGQISYEEFVSFLFSVSEPCLNWEDPGYDHLPKGFYDASNTGLPSDYGRWVGPADDPWWSVALADRKRVVDSEFYGGPGSQYTARGVFEQPHHSVLMNINEAKDFCERAHRQASQFKKKQDAPKPCSLWDDAGHRDLPHGFYDAMGSHYPCDYGRWVGSADDPWWSVALASRKGIADNMFHGHPGSQYTTKGAFNQPPEDDLLTLSEAKHICEGFPTPVPRWRDVDDLGHRDRPRGFYDATGDGFPTDYGRWVGPGDNAWWSVAARDTNQVGKYYGKRGGQYSDVGVFAQPGEEDLLSLDDAEKTCGLSLEDVKYLEDEEEADEGEDEDQACTTQ